MPLLTLAELDEARQKATQARARYIAAKTGTCEFCLGTPAECQCPVNGHWPKSWEGFWHGAYEQLTIRTERAVLRWIAEMPLRDALYREARDLIRWFDHTGFDDPKMLTARIESLRATLGDK